MNQFCQYTISSLEVDDTLLLQDQRVKQEITNSYQYTHLGRLCSPIPQPNKYVARKTSFILTLPLLIIKSNLLLRTLSANKYTAQAQFLFENFTEYFAQEFRVS